MWYAAGDHFLRVELQLWAVAQLGIVLFHGLYIDKPWQAGCFRERLAGVENPGFFSWLASDCV